MPQYKAVIVKGSCFFKVINPDTDMRSICYKFTKRFIVFNFMQRDKTGAVPQTVFAAALKDRTEFRFHINAYSEFEALLKQENINPNLIKIEQLGDYEIFKFPIKMKKGFKLRDYQIPVYEYLIKSNDGYNKMVGMYTGGGKGATSMAALAHLGMRTIVIVKPGYIKKWVDEFIEKMDIKLSEIMQIDDTKNLKAFLLLCEEGEIGDIKYIVLSNRIYLNWLKAYEEFGKDSEALGYSFAPDELFVKAKAGIRLIDEVHQDFHLNFRCDLYTHCKDRISLSATLDTYDPSIKAMYETAYPSSKRGPDVKAPKHVFTYSVFYRTHNWRQPNYQLYGSANYSHIAYEQWIMKDKTVLYRYMAMIKSVLDKSYVSRRQSGQKALIFAASVKFCTLLTKYLKAHYPHLSVERFCENDPIENLHNPDIRVSNVIKSGTAHDIKGLVTTILTIAVNSLQSNLQIFGRLRQIPEVKTEFYYFSNLEIDKHKKYHLDKAILLQPRSLAYQEISYPEKI